MAYDYITKHTSPNRNARPKGQKPESITIHHWGKDGQRFASVVDYLCRAGGNSSAHYVAEAGKVACIVDPDERAWHAGDSRGNDVSIGIECRPEATDGDYATVAELIANLRATYGNLPLVPHSSWKATACPGRWDLTRLDALARGQKPTPAPAPKPKPQPAPAPTPTPSSANRALKRGSTGDRVRRLQATLRRNYPLYAKHLAVDGNYGPDTEAKVREFQRRAGLTVDGIAGPATHAKLGLAY